ncbi:MAG: peptidylprolyl isomerase [Fidelibacterota bacterium]
MQKYLFITSFLVILFFSCEKHKEESLAVVNGNTIALKSFIQRYNDFLFQTQLQDNLLNRNLFLNSLIDEILIVDYANDSGIINDPAVIREKQRLYDQLLLNQFFNHQISPKTNATESELRRLFTWSKTSIHVRHLFSKNLATIKKIQKEIQSGIQWDILAKTYFNDPTLKDNGGDIGWMNMGEMDPAFEVVAFSLTGDEISAPVKTRNGYSIIQVIEREKDIFLTEQDYQHEKAWLEQLAVQYKKLPAVRAYTDSVEAELNIHFSQNNLSKLFNAIVYHTESSHIYNHSPLVFFKDGNHWTVQETYQKLNDLSRRQFNHITTEENLKNIIRGLAVRNIFLAEAEKMRLEKSALFTETFTQKYNAYLINLCLENCYNSIPLDTIDQIQSVKTAYINFRNELANKSSISVDSLKVKSFILNQAITL